MKSSENCLPFNRSTTAYRYGSPPTKIRRYPPLTSLPPAHAQAAAVGRDHSFLSPTVELSNNQAVADIQTRRMDPLIFNTCQEEFPDGDGLDLLECVSNALEGAKDAKQENLVDFLFVLAGAMVFFMQAGFATLCAGAVRVKNVQNTMLKNLLDACGAAIAFFLVGKSRDIQMSLPCEHS